MSEIPTTTKEYRLQTGTGIDGLTITQANVVPPNSGEVLIKIRAVSLQYRDLAVATGKYPLGSKDNLVPCSDCAGEVIAVGSAVTDWKKGDRVCANFNIEHIFGDITLKGTKSGLGAPIDGVLTEYKVFPAYCLVKIPDHLSYEEASTLPCAAVTAYNALNGPVPLKGGDYLLTQGTGGVSIFAVQFGRAVGATVIATTSSNEKAKVLKNLGAEHIINYKETPNWSDEVLKITGGRGVDHVVEIGGTGTIKQAFNSIKFAGWVHTIGFLAEAGESSNLLFECLAKEAYLRGILIGSRTMFENMNKIISARQIKPVVDSVFSFEEAAKAYKYLESQKHVGKVVIKVA